MILLTGDTHGNFLRLEKLQNKFNLIDKDTLIILGDVGLNFERDWRDEKRKEFVNAYPFTTFCIHGNHEMRPWHLSTCLERSYRGGTVWYEEAYPHIVYAKDGEVYDFDGLSCMVIGGAYSVDKHKRLAFQLPWFEDEQPSDEIKKAVEQALSERNWKIDVVLSHTCPERFIPIEMFLPGVDQSKVDTSTEEWLGKIEEKLSYKRWYCGHYHLNKHIEKLEFLFEEFQILDTDKIGAEPEA